MAAKRQILTAVTLISAMLLAMCSRPTSIVSNDENKLVRLAVIEVDTTQIQPYHEFLREEIEASILVEPGVITLYGVAEKKHPQYVTLFETYADSSQYKDHLTTPHFQKYKQETLQMVKHLELVQMQPILYHRKAELPNARSEALYIRLIKIEIDSSQIESFKTLATSVMLPGIRKESGVLVMYALSEKDHPTRVSILEVYENLTAYHKHIVTPHYMKYKEEAKKVVQSLKLIDVDPILLGSKPE